MSSSRTLFSGRSNVSIVPGGNFENAESVGTKRGERSAAAEQRDQVGRGLDHRREFREDRIGRDGIGEIAHLGGLRVGGGDEEAHHECGEKGTKTELHLEFKIEAAFAAYKLRFWWASQLTTRPISPIRLIRPIPKPDLTTQPRAQLTRNLSVRIHEARAHSNLPFTRSSHYLDEHDSGGQFPHRSCAAGLGGRSFRNPGTHRQRRPGRRLPRDGSPPPAPRRHQARPHAGSSRTTAASSSKPGARP